MKLSQLFKHESRTPYEKFFSNVVGYDDLKELIYNALHNRKGGVHINLCGPPASSKTVFILQAYKKLENALFVDATNASGQGIRELLFENPKTKYVFIDEIDKLSKADTKCLLNVMETGILQSTKVKGKKEMFFEGITVVATCNDINALSGPMRSRMLELHLPEYTYEDFVEICKRVCEIDVRIAEKLAFNVWNLLKTKDLRDCIKLGKLVSKLEDVDTITNTFMKYSIYKAVK